MLHAIAIELLRADRRAVMHLLDLCSAPRPRSVADRTAIVARLCAVLRAQLRVEEEIFYPELPLDAATLQDARNRCAQSLDALAALADRARQPGPIEGEIDLLRQVVARQAVFDETRCFPFIGKLDLDDLGDRMAARRAFLLDEPLTQADIGRTVSAVH